MNELVLTVIHIPTFLRSGGRGESHSHSAQAGRRQCVRDIHLVDTRVELGKDSRVCGLDGHLRANL